MNNDRFDRKNVAVSAYTRMNVCMYMAHYKIELHELIVFRFQFSAKSSTKELTFFGL